MPSSLSNTRIISETSFFECLDGERDPATLLTVNAVCDPSGEDTNDQTIRLSLWKY
ncbi:MAG: hypothetical protein JW841_09890 [Deltaproteobacteria bacterium]|nr:hypothetical protein [Deltaproteobacteria bacterium]